jgi:hypothetical protein
MWPFTKRYTPWALYAKNQVRTKETFNPLWGSETIKEKVLVDIYIKSNKKTGLPKYKYIEKPFSI